MCVLLVIVAEIDCDYSASWEGGGENHQADFGWLVRLRLAVICRSRGKDTDKIRKSWEKFPPLGHHQTCDEGRFVPRLRTT